MSQRKGWIRLYLADIRPLYEKNTWQRAYAYVDEERKRRADACRQPGARAASLAAGVLARYALRQNGVEKGSLSYGEKGQPLPEATADGQRLWLSLSHSGDYAVCAVSDRPVGVDIQKKEPIRIGMLRHFFSEEAERAFLLRYGMEKDGERADRVGGGQKADDEIGKNPLFLPEPAAEEFLRLWTVKESYMKLTGAGMGLGFERITVDLEKRTVREEDDAKLPCRLVEYRAPAGYFLSACVLEEEHSATGKD